MIRTIGAGLLLVLLGGMIAGGTAGNARARPSPVREVNAVARPDPAGVIVIAGPTLFDGRGGPPVPDAVVVVRGDRIAAAGRRAGVRRDRAHPDPRSDRRSFPPHAERGQAYAREMELLVEGGLTPLEALTAGTLENARFFRVADRLGSVQAGKLADLVLVEGDPVKDIGALRRVRRVMLNGRWIH